MNIFGRPGMLMYFQPNDQPMIYIHKWNGVETGNVTVTYENRGIAQQAVMMFNGQEIFAGNRISAAITNYALPLPTIGRSQFQKGENFLFLLIQLYNNKKGRGSYILRLKFTSNRTGFW